MYGAPLDAVTGMPFGGWGRFLRGVLLPPKNTPYAFSLVPPGKRKFLQSVPRAQPRLDQVTGKRTETVPAGALAAAGCVHFVDTKLMVG